MPAFANYFIMAKYDGIFEIQGTLKGMTFYKTQDGLLIRTKGGISRDRIKNDPAFQRTRENGTEFAQVAQCGQLIRKGLGGMLKLARDRRMSSRMMSRLSKVKNLDTTSPRGERKVGIGMATPEGKTLMKGFDFNDQARFDRVFRSLYSLDTVTGTFSVDDFLVSEMLSLPEGATNVSLSVAVGRVDFATGEYATAVSPKTNLAVTDPAQALSLVPAAIPAGDGFLFFYFLLEFFQDINGIQYPLKNHAHNVLCLLDVTD